MDNVSPPPPPPSYPAHQLPTAAGKRPAWPWVVGAIVAALVLVGGVIAGVLASDDEQDRPAADPPASCPEVGEAPPEDAELAWSVEDDDGDDDDVTLANLQALCGGVLVTWERWDPRDDEREYPEKYEYVAYDLAGNRLWDRTLDSHDVTNVTSLADNRVVLVNDEEHDRATALDAWTGEELWQTSPGDRMALREPITRYPGVALATEEPGLGTGSGMVDLATGEITELEGSIAALAPEGPLMQREGRLTYLDLDGTERWSIDLDSHLDYRGYHGTLDLAIGESLVAATVQDYDLERDDIDDDDRLVAFDLATGEKKWEAPDITGTFPGADGGIGAVRRPDGAQEDVRTSGDRLPGELVLFDESGETRSASFHEITNYWEATGVDGVGDFLTDTGTGTVVNARLEQLGSPTPAPALAPRTDIAGYTTDGYLTVERAGRLTLRSWSDAAPLYEIEVEGVDPADAEQFRYRWNSSGPALVLDGAVVTYSDGVLRCYRRTS